MKGIDVPAGEFKVDPQGYAISILMEGGRCFQVINGQKLELHPYVGVQLEEFVQNGRDWYREDLAEYEPVDVLRYLRKV